MAIEYRYKVSFNHSYYFGYLTEIKTAGIGIAALIGIIALLLFFVSQRWVGIASWPEIALFLGGILMLILEMHTPGAGIFGVAGVAAILVSLFLVLGASAVALSVLSTSLVVAIALFCLFKKSCRQANYGRKLCLEIPKLILVVLLAVAIIVTIPVNMVLL